MAIEIRETIVTPDATGDVVQLHISDAPQDDESATFVVQILAKLPPLEMPLVAQCQRETLKIAQDALSVILQKTAKQITSAGHDLDPRPGK